MSEDDKKYEYHSNWSNPWVDHYYPLSSEEEKKKKEEEKWKIEGRCPKCGELGRFSHLQMTCSVHGPY